MHLHKKVLAAALLSLVLCGTSAFAKTILVVPQDDRPVDLDYTVHTAEKAGYTVLVPPKQYLSGSSFSGSPEQVWTWVEQNISRADACILSTDTLIYGGLVDSRKHNESIDVLARRENRIRSLHVKYPHIPLYAFATIMRSPIASSSGVEPYYYSKVGPSIYRISVLQDKMDSGHITKEETAELLSLKLSVPSEYLQDWFRRRSKNNQITKMLIKDVNSGVFTYFCLGHDDNSKFSQSALESRYINKDTKRLNKSKFGSFPGADQLALLLIARYHVDDNHLKPAFSVIYPLGRGEDTVPSYENQAVGKTIREHITAVGGTISDNGRPDLVLAVNTPLAKTGESSAFANFGMQKPSTTEFIDRIKDIQARNIPIAIADIYYANGSDNTLMSLLEKENLLYKVAAYDGWNTAGNTIGFAISQAILSPSMTEENRKLMLTEQYIDNWAYQANVRKNISSLLAKQKDKTKLTAAIKEETIAQIQEFAKKHLSLAPACVAVEFPWNRLFEINALVSPVPKYPVYPTKAAKERKKMIEQAAAERAAGEKSARDAAEKAIAEIQTKLSKKELTPDMARKELDAIQQKLWNTQNELAWKEKYDIGDITEDQYQTASALHKPIGYSPISLALTIPLPPPSEEDTQKNTPLEKSTIHINQ
ncbi:MAG: DUF4127 family protein [Dialister sp.]|nr:DUF4127 family protein [Dialister sp.]